MIDNNQIQETEVTMSNPFEEVEQRSLSQKLATVARWGTAVAAGVLSIKYGLDTKFVVQPSVHEQITDGIIMVNQALRTVAPPVAAGALLAHAGYRAASSRSDRMKAVYDFSDNDYSGLETDSSLRMSRKQKVTKFMAGLGLAASAGLFITTSTSVEQEVANGPVRAVEAAGEVLGDGEEPPVYIFDSPHAHFMNDSRVSESTVGDIKRVASSYGDDIQVNEFGRGLTNIEYENGETTTGFILSVPTELIGQKPPTTESLDCSTIPVIADDALNVSVGDELGLKEGLGAVVVGISDGSSAMNRSAITTGNEYFVSCFQDQDTNDPNYFGVAVSGTDVSTVESITRVAGVSESTAVISQDRFIDNNKKFWRANGTPILLQQIMYLASFAGIALASARKNSLQQNIKEIGTMMANGVQESRLKQIETIRGIRRTGKSMIMALPFVPVFAGALNASVRGLEVGTSVRDLAVGYTVLLGSTVISARRSVSKFVKQKTPAEMIKS